MGNPLPITNTNTTQPAASAAPVSACTYRPASCTLSPGGAPAWAFPSCRIWRCPRGCRAL